MAEADADADADARPTLTVMRMFFLSLVLVVVAIPLPAAAITEAVSDLVLIREGEVIEGDVLAGGTIVRVLGTVEGDLVAAAFERIEIMGTVTGDVLAAAPTVVVDGVIEGSLRSLAGRTTVRGDVEGDALVGSGSLSIAGTIAGDLYGALWSADVSGGVGDRVKVFARRVEVRGVVGGVIEGEIRRLMITESAAVSGGVVVVGDVTVEDGAEIGGSVRAPANQALPLRARSLVLLIAVVVLSIWMASGPVVNRLAPRWVERHVRSSSLVRGLLTGVVGVAAVGVAVASIWLIAAASPADFAVGLSLAGLAVAVAGIVLLGAAAIVGAVPATMQVGRMIGSPPDFAGAHARGVVAIAALSLVPWVGGVILTGFLLAAIGGTMSRPGNATGQTQVD